MGPCGKSTPFVFHNCQFPRWSREVSWKVLMALPENRQNLRADFSHVAALRPLSHRPLERSMQGFEILPWRTAGQPDSQCTVHGPSQALSVPHGSPTKTLPRWMNCWAIRLLFGQTSGTNGPAFCLFSLGTTLTHTIFVLGGFKHFSKYHIWNGDPHIF